MNEQFYTRPDLKGRGWTDTAIHKFIKEPDATKPNPVYPNAGEPMKLWLRSRVHEVEATEAFSAWIQASQPRRAAAKRGVATRVENMVQRMESVELTIVRGISDAEIRDLAASTHGGNYAGARTDAFTWSNRAARNAIRHNLTNYEQLWSICNRGETGQDAYDVLRGRIDALVDEAYPQYAELCDEEPARVSAYPPSK